MNHAVSIIIPYNTDRGYLSDAIESAEHQGIIIESQSDGSVGHNVNKGLQFVRTEYFCILAEDDLLTPYAIEDRLRAIGEADWVHSRGLQLMPDGARLPFSWHNPEPTLDGMLTFNQIVGSTTLYKTDLGRLFPWDESLTTAEEYDFHLRLLSQGIEPAYCDDITFLYRRHTEQKSIGNMSREYQLKRQETVEMIRKRYENA